MKARERRTHFSRHESERRIGIDGRPTNGRPVSQLECLIYTKF
jgi:hypothetical protein